MKTSKLIDANARVLITGGTGLVGRALTLALKAEGFTSVTAIGSKDADLRDRMAASQIFSQIRPAFLFHLAARVHGIGGNAAYKSDILVDNVLINTNVVEQARLNGVQKIIAMGSGCVYPELKGEKELFEEQVWTGPPHPSEDSYAHAKRLMLAQLNAAKEQYGLSSAFVISGNLYGPYDNFNLEEGHVIPSLVAKFHEAKCIGQSVKVWGSGIAVRDFTYADDVASALIAIFRNIEGPVNLGSGKPCPIRDIVDALHLLTGVPVEWDATKPDGQLVRYYNLDRLNSTGFLPAISLKEGIRRTYEWYASNLAAARK